MSEYDLQVPADGFTVGITQKLKRLALAAAAGLVLAPTVDFISLPAGYHMASLAEPAALHQWETGNGTRVAEAPMSLGQQITRFREAKDEATIAIRLLQQFVGSSPSAEVTTYVETVSAVAEAVPDELTAEVAARIAVSLRTARARLADEASSFPIWSAVARSVDPTTAPRTIPRRYLRWERRDVEPPLSLTRQDVRVDRAVRLLRGNDADSSSREG